MEEFVSRAVRFAVVDGIRTQMEAFRDGFESVFPMVELAMFSPNELRIMLCGDQSPAWSEEDLLNHTEPRNGYTRDSHGFKLFASVVAAFGGDERKAFLQFTTGCSALPPGGLANLNPRLTVVKKVDADDQAYPSVNTCVHYLKLPDYSTADIMRQRLLAATAEKGFHLN